MLLSDDLLSTAFLGPWISTATADARQQQAYLSLVHWYEAAKFMPHRRQFHDALLFRPSVKEARKYARMRQAAWRSDWGMVRHLVLVAGLGMLTLQRPELELRSCSLELVQDALASLDLPGPMVQTCAERFDAWRSAPRICVFGADDAAQPSVVGARLAKVVAAMPHWTLVTTCHRRTPWRVHDWALQQSIPVQYHGTPSLRHSRQLTSALIEGSDQVVVFEQRNQKRFDSVLQIAKRLKRKISLELYVSHAQPGLNSTLPGKVPAVGLQVHKIHAWPRHNQEK